MPPGPRWPRAVQTAAFILGAPRFLEACRQRYGSAVTLHTLFDDSFVMVFDPGLVKEVFQGSSAVLHAGEANALLGPIVGRRSVLLLDEGEHLRHRRLLLPPFHGQHLAGYEAAMIEATDLEIDSWPVGREFAPLASMHSLILRVITRLAFGYEPVPLDAELSLRLRPMIELTSRPRGPILMSLPHRPGSL